MTESSRSTFVKLVDRLEPYLVSCRLMDDVYRIAIQPAGMYLVGAPDEWQLNTTELHELYFHNIKINGVNISAVTKNYIFTPYRFWTDEEIAFFLDENGFAHDEQIIFSVDDEAGFLRITPASDLYEFYKDWRNHIAAAVNEWSGISATFNPVLPED